MVIIVSTITVVKLLHRNFKLASKFELKQFSYFIAGNNGNRRMNFYQISAAIISRHRSFIHERTFPATEVGRGGVWTSPTSVSEKRDLVYKISGHGVEKKKYRRNDIVQMTISFPW